MILLTGTNSFLGNKLLTRLIEKGEKVRCLDMYKPKNLPAQAEFIESDLQNLQVLKKACIGIDTIIHMMEVPKPQSGRWKMKKINVAGTQNLVTMAEKAGIKRMILLSSYSVYGIPKTPPVKESDKKRPVTAFGKDKLKAEHICLTLQKKGKLSLTIIRPAVILGSEVDDSSMLITLYMSLKMGNGNRLYISGSGNSKFQLVHPDDVVAAFTSALDSPVSGGKIYNIGSDHVPTQLEQVVKIKEKAGLNCEIRHISPFKAGLLSALFRPFKIGYLTKDHLLYLLNTIVLDNTAAKTDLKWAPSKDNIEIMLEAIEWYKKRKG